MKRLVTMLYILIIFISLFGSQSYAVAEIFTSLTCEYCPIARATLRYMSEGSDDHPYLIPLIWQEDGVNTSPGYDDRQALYGVSTLPHIRWGGSSVILGAGANTPVQFEEQYSLVTAIESIIDINLSFTTAENIITAIANITQHEPLPDNLNTNVVFVLTRSMDATQQGNYFASVVRYHTQTFEPAQTTYQQSIELDPEWDLERVFLVAFLQDFSPSNPVIYNADRVRLITTPRPINVRAYSNFSQISLAWDQPSSEKQVVSFNIYRDEQYIGNTSDLFFTDTEIGQDIGYSYEIETVYEGDEYSVKSIPCLASTIDNGQAQFGSGALVNTTSNAGPISIYYKSLRGQFILTRQELQLAGLVADAPISAIGFYIAQRPLYALPTFHLRLKHTDLTFLTNHNDGEWERDQTITSYNPPEGVWHMISLTQPLIWDGVNSILVDTAFGLVQGYNSSGQVRIVNYLLGYRYSRSDTQSQVNAITTTTDNYKPQVRISSPALAESDNTIVPITTRLAGNYPNPFNPSTTICFDLQKASNVVLQVYNVKGQLVNTLLNDYVSAGRHFVNWDGDRANGQKASSGVYLYRLQTSEYSETKRMILVK